MILPNIRKIFVPDPGFVIFEADLAGADAQVVAWDAGDEALKKMFRQGLPIHLENARAIFARKVPALLHATDDVVKATPSLNRFRQFAKIGVHATNYGCKARTLAGHLNITVPEAEEFQALWFKTHPDIEEWIRGTEQELFETRAVRNAFGYVRHYFDRPEEILPEALAWRPQSTVAITINKAMVLFRKWVKAEGLRAQLLLQVHDSFVGQVHASEAHYLLSHLQEKCRVVIPYADPLTIPLSLSASAVSWGDCTKNKGEWLCGATIQTG